MTGGRRRRLGSAALAAAASASLAVAGGKVEWEDLAPADWLFEVATRFAEVDGRLVHYPTPSAELALRLEERAEADAKRYLADARLALGDRAGAVAAIEAWAEASGATAWDEAARWAAAQGEMDAAFRAAARALGGLEDEEKRELLAQRVAWADAHPGLADPVAVRAERAAILPDDAAAVEDWLRALEKAGRVEEAIAGVETARALSPERRLLLRSDLAADHGDPARAFAILDEAVAGEGDWPLELKRAYAQRAAAARPALVASWREALERGFDGPALVRLATYFQGQERGDRAAELLRQVERRYEEALDPAGLRLLARLHGEIDAVPEAFRARLAAAAKSDGDAAEDDLAALAGLALRAGARPLGWGAYAEEPYRWAARADRTPGFWTGAVSFLLTGTDWKEALGRLEADSVPERTFATARALVLELERRAPSHPELFALRAAILARHVERGEGREALALLPLVETGPADVVAAARRFALLALRQVEVPLEEETRLWRARLAGLARDGSRPRVLRPERAWSSEAPASGVAWTRSLPGTEAESYRDVLDEAVARLDERDGSHRAAASLLLGEMDRLPRAEGLWEELAQRLESWSLDDELGPRYERALERFSAPGFWPRAARWHARRARHRDLDRLATELAARFRGAAVFERAPLDDGVRLEVPEQPRVGARVRLVAWADWVRLKALERFPHSPAVFREAQARLVRRSAAAEAGGRREGDRVVVDDAVLDERGFAVLFADDAQRERYLAEAARAGTLPARLAAWEASERRTPVEDLLLFEGHARLSQFEAAAAPADRLAAAYPGERALAGRVLALHRSLAGLDPAHAAPARALVARTAPALRDPGPLWVELGELEHEGGRPERAREAWRRVLDPNPRDPERVSELATVLWDYGETDEALATIEDARRRLARGSLLAFEAGVLREEKRDLDGAIREYLAAGLPAETCFCSAFERDQRSLRRLAQLLGRERARRAVEARLAVLRPGVTGDEEALVALLPLATIRMPDADLDWTSDDWIDAMDHPVDPAAREARAADRERWRAATREGQAKVAALLLARTRAMVDAATGASFLDAVTRWAGPLVAASAERAEEVALTAAVMARRAALAGSAEERVAAEVARARYLLENGRTKEADAAWAGLAARVAALPEGAPRLRAEAERAAYLERAQGTAAAAAEWERLAARYPWSLGLLEDRLAFLGRAGRSAEGRAVLEEAAARAAAGHREALLERLARESIEAADLAPASRAVEALLASPALEDAARLSAAHLLARLQLRSEPAADLAAIAGREGPRLLRPELRAELDAQLARAAAREGAWAASVTRWIEALNRRLDRGWLREACAAAELSPDPPAFAAFFERQRARSPRDVRWAVALREIRLYFGDVPGALEAARAAIAVRPDRGSLWFEAADLLARLGRPGEGAELLAQWAKSRPGDEDAAGRRAALLAAARDPEGALAVEREALAAYAKAAPGREAVDRELGERRGRAARRLLDLGLPEKAWALLATGPGGRLLPSGLGPYGEAELALAASRFLPFLRPRMTDERARSAAAGMLAERGRPEQREEIVRFLADEVLRARPASGPPGGLALSRAWPFAQEAGLEGALRVELARRLLARRGGPWSVDTPEPFVDAVATGLIGEPLKLLEPPLERLWAAELARAGRSAELFAFLAPRWDALVARVRSAEPVSAKSERVAWASWLDDSEILARWSEGATADGSRLAVLGELMGERRAWDRLWALAARRWDTAPLVAALPDEARGRWFRLWQQPSPFDPDPARRTRGERVERATRALGRLVASTPGAASDAAIAELRGPGRIGAILDAGQGFDVGLWGERPSPAWLVLEALARRGQPDGDAALVPLEVRDRGGEARRLRAAARLAEAEGDAGLALALAGAVPTPNAADLVRRLRLLQAAGRPEDAVAALRAEARRLQPRIDEAGYRSLARAAEDAGLPDPLTLFDPAVRVPGPFAAFVADRRGIGAADGLVPIAIADFRSALAARYGRRPRALAPDETRFSLAQLWANDAGPLPGGASLRRLGGVWPHAGTWLAEVRTGERPAAVRALEALPDDAPLRALLERTPGPPSEAARLLLLRARLLRGEDDAAVALFRQRLAEVDDAGLGFTPVRVTVAGDGEEDGLVPDAGDAPATDAFVSELRAWLAPFREARKTTLVAADARQALERHAVAAPGSAEAAALALDLASTPTEKTRALERLERAWRLGDLDPATIGPIVEAAARVAEADGSPWIARLGGGTGFEATLSRARRLARLRRPAEAAADLVRSRATWTAVQEVRAFDLWRTLGAEAAGGAPAEWVAARAFWAGPAADPGAALRAHLRAHPLDLRAARAALRTAAAGDPDAMTLAGRAIAQPWASELVEPWRDDRLLDLRAARALWPAAPRAARSRLGELEPTLASDLERRRLPAAEARAALADGLRILAAAGDRASSASLLAALEDQAPAEARALRAEMAALAPADGPRPFRIADGRPEPWRPRDLDWAAVEAQLDAEGVR